MASELHMGSERCPHGSRATIALYGRAAEGFGQKFVGVSRGGILEPRGQRRRSWTLLDGTLIPAGSATAPTPPRGAGAAAGSVCASWTAARRGCGGGASKPTCGRPRASGSAPSRPGSRRQPRHIPGVVTAALGHSAARSLTPETQLRERLGCSSIFRRRYRQSWALVGILGGDQLSTAEDKQEHHGNGTRGLAIAQRDFLTQGTRFTAFSGWIKGVPYNGFKVEVSEGIIPHLVDETTSWLPGVLVSSLPVQIILYIRLKSLISFLVPGKTTK